MSDEIKPEPSEKDEISSGDSSFLGVSVRAWLAIMILGTICTMSLLKYDVVEPLYTLGGIALGYYMGQKKQT